MKVLVADDQAMSRTLLEYTIEGLGHVCLVAEDGDQAWELFEQHRPDVVISDWMMPGLEGPALCRRIRAVPGQPYVYFVVLTILQDKHHSLEAIEAGADQYLIKPADPDDLRTCMIAAERVLGLHRRHEAMARVSERLVAAPEPEDVLCLLLDEAAQLILAERAAAYSWAGTGSEPELLAMTPADAVVPEDEAELVRAALEEKRPRSIVEPPRMSLSTPLPPRSAMLSERRAIPIVCEGRSLGAIVLSRAAPFGAFTPAELETVQILSSLAGAILLGHERAQLAAIRLAATELADLLNNDLAKAVAAVEILRVKPSPAPGTSDFLGLIDSSLYALADHVRQFTRVAQMVVKTTAVGRSLDVALSANPIAHRRRVPPRPQQPAPAGRTPRDSNAGQLPGAPSSPEPGVAPAPSDAPPVLPGLPFS